MLTKVDVAQGDRTIRPRKRQVAKVLLADSDLASRLSLVSLLEAAGYAVDGAATSAEAISRMEHHKYQLVLADLRAESEEAGSRILAYARQKDYRPATALLSSELRETSRSAAGQTSAPLYGRPQFGKGESESHSVVRMSDENVSYLLAHVANMISNRASRRMRRAPRVAQSSF